MYMLSAIEIRFSSRPSQIPVPKTTSLPVFSDNVLPSMLIHLGVLDITSCSDLSQLFPDHSSDLEKLLAGAKVGGAVSVKLKEPPLDGPALTEKRAYILRAATIDACEIIVDVDTVEDNREADDRSSATTRGFYVTQAWVYDDVILPVHGTAAR